MFWANSRLWHYFFEAEDRGFSPICPRLVTKFVLLFVDNETALVYSPVKGKSGFQERSEAVTKASESYSR